MTTPGAVEPVSAPIRPPAHRAGSWALVVGAIGVVFGDIGTSPLYAMQTVFSIEHNEVKPTPDHVYGIISLVFWSVTAIVSVKYVALVMRADNDGEGGILALAALVRRHLHAGRRTATAMLLGVVGAALFFGDSLITPAISVMSAVEGIAVVDPDAEHAVLPVSVVVITCLFAIQRWGTGVVGRAFGPVMILWFGTLAALGVPHIVANPAILAAISPTHAALFLLGQPFIAFIALGAVVLTITGAEALYADMGHFGAGPIRRAWFVVVFPALTVNYLGQGAMLLDDPSAIDNPFFRLAPSWATLPLVVIATAATVIASQAVISGAFSVARQATRLGYLPRMTVRHTSATEAGQTYLPAINWILFVGVLLLIAAFRSSARLATAYGLAVTGTLILTSLLFLLLARDVWGWGPWRLVVPLLVFVLESVFFAANVTKLVSGGWLPVLIAVAATLVMVVWHRGAGLVAQARRDLEGPLDDLLAVAQAHEVPRVPGVAVYPHPHPGYAPLALRSNLEFNQVLHRMNVIVCIEPQNVPHVRHVERLTVDLGHASRGVVTVRVRVGFNDSQDIPKALTLAVATTPSLRFNPAEATYVLSVLKVRPGPSRGLAALRDRLFVWMNNTQADPPQVYHLPPGRAVVMGEQIDLPTGAPRR